jgi:hypothetical protein
MLARDPVRVTLEPSFCVFLEHVLPLSDERIRRLAFELEHLVDLGGFATGIDKSLPDLDSEIVLISDPLPGLLYVLCILLVANKCLSLLLLNSEGTRLFVGPREWSLRLHDGFFVGLDGRLPLLEELLALLVFFYLLHLGVAFLLLFFLASHLLSRYAQQLHLRVVAQSRVHVLHH